MGELHHTPEIARALARLDVIEGFAGYGNPGSLLYRALSFEKPGPCWTYVYAGARNDGPLISSGDWCRR